MPLQKIQFKPGINREGTSLSNEGGWFDGDKIRFRSGYPEKIGGWTVNTFNRFLGVCRSLWNWITLGEYNLLGVGTNLKFYVEEGGKYNDITPIRLTTVDTTSFVVGRSTISGTALTDTATSIVLVSAADYPVNGGLLLVESEQIRYGTKVGNTLTNCIRGYNGTTPAAHPINTIVASAMAIVTDNTVTDLNSGDFVTFSGAASLGSGIITAGILVDTVNNEIVNYDYLPSVNEAVTFAGPNLPVPLVEGPTYYVKEVNKKTSPYRFTVSAVLGGSAVDITTSGGDPKSVIFSGTGITAPVLNQEYQIGEIVSTTSYVIELRQAVTGDITTTNGGAPVFSNFPVTGTGGGAVDSAYQINIGYETLTLGTGWGAGPWNAGSITDAWAHGWGTGYTTGIALQLRLWSQINFGQILLFAPRKGTLYYWDPSGGVGSTVPIYSRGLKVTGNDVPDEIFFITVSDATRIVIAFGASDFAPPNGTGVFDPLLVRWTAQESYTDWLPSATNQAGSYRLSHGSQIVGALQTRQEILVWTDSAVYSMQYLGLPYVWGFTLLADNISIMSPNAVATAAGITYWMGADKFYAYTGRVETLPCSVRQYVYDNLNKAQSGQIFAGTNEGYNEIWWFYCSITGLDGTGTIDQPNQYIDSYVVFNHLDRVWYYGTLPRTAWLDSPLRVSPMATTLDNLLVFHEQGADDGTTNPASPIVAYVQSSDFDIEEGDNYAFIWRMIPDLTFDGSTTDGSQYPQVNITLLPKQNPGAPYGYGPNPDVKAAQSYAQRHTYTVQEFTQIVYTRVRGRDISFRISSDTLGTQWQLGVPAIDIRKDGKR